MDQQQNITNLTFKEIYLILLCKKNEAREWEAKWQNTLRRNDINWEKIWSNLHNTIHNPIVKSSNWELIHLNYWCSYKAREACKLCREVELDPSHIGTECKVLTEIIKSFQLHDKYNSKIQIAFGLNENHYHNFILFHIKSVVFKMRFHVFNSVEQAILVLTLMCKQKIRKDIQNGYELAKLKGGTDHFKRMFNCNRQVNNMLRICSINVENDLIFYI